MRENTNFRLLYTSDIFCIMSNVVYWLYNFMHVIHDIHGSCSSYQSSHFCQENNACYTV